MKGGTLRIFFRSLLIQGGWNYRNLLGSGFAWALLPRSPGAKTAAEEQKWVEEHSGHFNLHPYLAPAALAAAAKMEAEGRPVEEIGRFKGAIGSLFGSVGDGLFWNGWRPVTLIAAMGAGLLGLATPVVVVGFLFLYNLLHLRVRYLGVKLGDVSGVRIGESVRELEIPQWTERIRTVGVLFLGLIAGVLLAEGGRLDELRVVLIAAGGIALALGWILGEAVHRWIPAVLLLLVLVGYLPIFG
jgi:PTS system mannose-specific IID component